MKNLTIIKIKIISLIIVAVFMTSITIILLLRKNTAYISDNNYTSKTISSQESQENLTNSPNPIKGNIYEVKAVNGEIAVFQNGQEFSVLLDKVRIENLPQSDKELLENGKSFDNYKDLIEFLENYE